MSRYEAIKLDYYKLLDSIDAAGVQNFDPRPLTHTQLVHLSSCGPNDPDDDDDFQYDASLRVAPQEVRSRASAEISRRLALARDTDAMKALVEREAMAGRI